MMTLCTLLIGGFILYLAYHIATMFIKGSVLLLLGMLLSLAFLIFTLRTLHIITI